MENEIQSPFDFIIGISRKVSWYLVLVSSLCLAILMLINIVDIIGAKWFNFAIPGTIDYSEELQVVITLCPLAYVALVKGNINVSLFIDRFPRLLRKGCLVLSYFVCILVSGFLTWRVFVRFLHVYDIWQLKEGVQFPIWPSNLAIFISFTLLTLTLILMLARDLVRKH